MLFDEVSPLGHHAGLEHIICSKVLVYHGEQVPDSPRSEPRLRGYLFRRVTLGAEADYLFHALCKRHFHPKLQQIGGSSEGRSFLSGGTKITVVEPRCLILLPFGKFPTTLIFVSPPHLL